MKKNDVIEIIAGKMIYQGLCLSDLDGKKVFLDKCLPGDKVRAVIKKNKKDYFEAVAVEIIEPSQCRIAPLCRHFESCGGCVTQNMKYADQLDSKEDIVKDIFQRIGKIKDVEINKIIGSDEIYFYRNKMEYSFSDKRWLETGIEYSEDEKNFALGLHYPGRYDKVLQLEECLLQSKYSNDVRNFFYKFFFQKKINIFSLSKKDGLLKSLIIREAKNTDDKMISLVTTYYDEILMEEIAELIVKNFPETTTLVNVLSDKNISSTIGNEVKIIFGNGIIREKLLDYQFEISPNSFFQTNTKQAEKMLRFLRKESVEGDLLLDLFCGSGAIGLVLSDKFRKVFGLEISEESISFARRNAKLNNIFNTEFIVSDLNKSFNYNILGDYKKLTVILDPPRSGVHKNTLSLINLLKPDEIFYISCNPTTQARDLQDLLPSYSIDKIQPFDFFSNSYHIENITLTRFL